MYFKRGRDLLELSTSLTDGCGVESESSRAVVAGVVTKVTRLLLSEINEHSSAFLVNFVLIIDLNEIYGSSVKLDVSFQKFLILEMLRHWIGSDYLGQVSSDIFLENSMGAGSRMECLNKRFALNFYFDALNVPPKFRFSISIFTGERFLRW